MKTQITKDKQEEFDQFLEMVSPSLKIKVQDHLYIVFIKKNKVIQQSLSKFGNPTLIERKNSIKTFASRLMTYLGLAI